MSRLRNRASLGFTLLALGATGMAQTLPGTFHYSWVGNSFMNHTAKAWIPDEVRDLCVAGDGTVFTAGYAEAGGSGLAIKNGEFFGRYSGFNSGFGDPVKAVTTDGTNVYWGGGSGAYLGTIKPSLHGFNGGGGQVDLTHGMTACLRSNGEYVLFTEDAGHNLVIMTRWRPNGDSTEAAISPIDPAGRHSPIQSRHP